MNRKPWFPPGAGIVSEQTTSALASSVLPGGRVRLTGASLSRCKIVLARREDGPAYKPGDDVPHFYQETGTALLTPREGLNDRKTEGSKLRLHERLYAAHRAGDGG